MSQSPEELRLERKRQVALGYRILAAQRWGDLGDGHISARCDPATARSWPDTSSAPVTEIPTVMLQQS